MEIKENQKRCDEKNQNKQEMVKKKTKVKKSFCLIMIFGIIGIVLTVFIALIVMKGFEGFESIDNAITDTVVGEEGKVKTISSMSLEKVFEISELSTTEYTYNAIARVYDENGMDVRYYVAYEGKVTAGIDFSRLQYDVDEDQKTITVVIPEIEFHDKTVDPGTLKFIFKDKKSETETVHQEAFKLCEKDMEERIWQEDALLEQARQNTIAVVQALVEPWVRQIDSEYRVIIR